MEAHPLRGGGDTHLLSEISSPEGGFVVLLAVKKAILLPLKKVYNESSYGGLSREVSFSTGSRQMLMKQVI